MKFLFIEVDGTDSGAAAEEKAGSVMAAPHKLAMDLAPILPLSCSFCGSPEGLQVCTWPDVGPVLKSIADAEVGDIWITQQAGKRGKIVSITDLTHPYDGHVYGRSIRVKIPPHPVPYPYGKFIASVFVTEGQMACGKVCCVNCFRELGPEKFCCRNHWRSWEQM